MESSSALGSWLGALSLVIVPVVLAVAVHAVWRRVVPSDVLISSHDVAGYLVAVVGVLYAVVLGFLVGTVWSQFQTDQQTADLEAGYVGDAFGFAGTLAEPVRSRVRTLLAAYAVEVREREWRLLSEHKRDSRASDLIRETIGAMSVSPGVTMPTLGGTLKAAFIEDAEVNNIRNIIDTRRVRLVQADNHLPRAMYGALVLGGMTVFAFLLLFSVKRAGVQLGMTAIVVLCISIQFTLIVELSTPYSGTIRVSPAAWDYIISNNQLTRPDRSNTP